MSSQNILCKSNTVHMKPACTFTPITFKTYGCKYECCEYKNKFGEYSCEKECENNHFCSEHHEKKNKFINNLRKIMKAVEKIKNAPHSLDSTMKIMYNMFNYFIVHKECLVNYQNDPHIDNLQHCLVKKISFLINELISGKISRNILIYKNSSPIEFHINKLNKIQLEIKNLRTDIQIHNAQYSLVSNNIKIHKLSEIYLKTKPNSNESCAVISKGIDKIILSFF